MTLKQAITISLKAKAMGYNTRVEAGRLQFVTVEYAKNGKSKVIPKSDWLSFEQASAYVNGK